MSPFERVCENTKASKAVWEASRQIAAAARMLEIALRDAEPGLQWRVQAIFAAHGVSEESAQRLNRIADELMFKERARA